MCQSLKPLSLLLGCRGHIFPLMALKGWRGEGSSQSRITESSMCGHQLFYISRKLGYVSRVEPVPSLDRWPA